jgi:hypothetical protein
MLELQTRVLQLAQISGRPALAAALGGLCNFPLPKPAPAPTIYIQGVIPALAFFGGMHEIL